LARHPAMLLCLAERVSALQAPDATWQIVAELGGLDRSWPQAESLLLRFTGDEDVRRRALLALADSGSPMRLMLRSSSASGTAALTGMSTAAWRCCMPCGSSTLLNWRTI